MQSKIIPTDSTTATIRYVMSPKARSKQRVEERVAQVYAQHSGISTAAADFLDLRQEHGQQNKVRKSKGRYYEPDDAAEATHLKRSEEHTSELQSRFDLVCRLLLEKKTII